MNLLIAQVRERVGERERKAEDDRKALAKIIDPKERAHEIAEARRFAAVLHKDPDAAAAAAEELSRTWEQDARKTLENDNPEHDTWWAAELANIAEIEHALADLSEERKAAPACHLGSALRLGDALPTIVPIGTRGCRPLVRPNWDYFDRRLPRTSLQLITISGASHCLREMTLTPARKPNRYGCSVNLALLNGTDWNRMLALLDK